MTPAYSGEYQTFGIRPERRAKRKLSGPEVRFEEIVNRLLEPRFWPAVGTCPVLRLTRHVPTATQKKLRDIDYRQQIAVAACVSAWRRHKILRTRVSH